MEIKINGQIFSFAYASGWLAKEKAGEAQAKLLNELWKYHFGAENAVYPLSVAGLHTRAIIKEFKAEVLKEFDSEPLNTDSDVVY